MGTMENWFTKKEVIGVLTTLRHWENGWSTGGGKKKKLGVGGATLDQGKKVFLTTNQDLSTKNGPAKGSATYQRGSKGWGGQSKKMGGGKKW